MGPANPSPQVVRRLLDSAATLPEGVPPGPRRRILEAALGLFSEYGFYGTSIRDLAAGAGITSATLYGHYPSKDHILAELLLIGHEEHHRRLRRAILAAGNDPVEQLRAVVDAHVRCHAELPSLAVVANSELHVLTPELGSEALAVRRQSEQLVTDIVERGVAMGVFDVPDTTLATAAIGGMGIRVANWFHEGGPWTVDEVARAYVEFAERIVGVRER